MTHWSADTYIKAWNYATLAHAGQTYGGWKEGMRVDYLNHIGSVGMEIMHLLSVSDQQYDPDLMLQCAFLHDVIEDCGKSYEELLELFGKAVADGVLALTKSSGPEAKHAKMTDSLNRIKQQPKEVWIVKMADRVTNLYHPPYYWNTEKIVAYQEEARLIYEALKEADSYMAARLEQKIRDYSAFIKP